MKALEYETRQTDLNDSSAKAQALMMETKKKCII